MIKRELADGRPGAVAVALHYERHGTGAPRVVASGRGALGEKIIETARANDVPLENNPALAAALAQVEIGDEVPIELYKVVAEVLRFILRMSGNAG
jgi:flagellar biosynthesis protein